MQASKILPGAVYAIMHNNRLVRFRVMEVVTRRGRATGSPHDYQSTVEGRVVEPGFKGPDKLTLAPDAILGPFEAYAELQAKDAAEKADKERLNAEAAAEHERMWKRLYELCDLPIPVGKRGRWGSAEYGDDDVFHRRYDGAGFEVSKEGAAVLIAALERATRLATVQA